MIGKSLPEWIFIRLSIFTLRIIPVMATLYTAYRFATRGPAFTQAVDYWLLSECFFYGFFYVPKSNSLQKAAVHPPLASQAQRLALFERIISIIPDFERFTFFWFQSKSSTDVKRENYVDWLLWALLSMDRKSFIDTRDSTINEELDGYMAKIESFVGRKIDPGYNPSIQPLRLTLDPVVTLPRPLLWYSIVAIVDLITHFSLYTSGFRHYSPSQKTKVFPPRLQTILSTHSMVQIPYWYRPHTSRDKLPVIMFHGVGIGLWPYVPFLRDLSVADPDVGILALEILPISMRITGVMPSQEQFIAQLTHILNMHRISEFVLVSHSYGSVLTTHILRSSLAFRLASMILVDPVTFLLHLGDVAYNFVYRQPRTANQWQLWYFASRDLGISHAMSRNFFWSANILWKEDLEGRKVAVILSGEDQIVNTREVWTYLTGQKGGETTDAWQDAKGYLSVLWYPGLDHAQVFDTQERRKPIVDFVIKFSVARQAT